MIKIAKYKVELRLNGILIGDIREHAQNLTWVRKRTRMGVDSISFTVNDLEFGRWCTERDTTLGDILKPLALDCRIIRDEVPIVGGFLATMPAYHPSGNSANLKLEFDGFINYLSGVYLVPGNRTIGTMGDVIKGWMRVAEFESEDAGKSFGFTAGQIDSMNTIESTFDNYKDIKSAITDRCDNTSGAGPFEFYVHPDRTYDVIKDENFGEEITDYIIEYPTLANVVSATSISAKEVSGFASKIIGIGSGNISPTSGENTAIFYSKLDRDAVREYGYREKILQLSSISTSEALIRNVESELASCSNMKWQPQIQLSGRMVAPSPTGTQRIWIGDTVTIQNNQDQTGMTSGKFRVNELKVKVESTGAETITPTLSSSENINTSSFAKDWVRVQNEILNLKTASN